MARLRSKGKNFLRVSRSFQNSQKNVDLCPAATSTHQTRQYIPRVSFFAVHLASQETSLKSPLKMATTAKQFPKRSNKKSYGTPKVAFLSVVTSQQYIEVTANSSQRSYCHSSVGRRSPAKPKSPRPSSVAALGVRDFERGGYFRGET
jgi:hypothetical protein